MKKRVKKSASPDIMKTCACFNFRKSARIVTQIFDRALAPSGIKSTQFSLVVGTKRLQPVPMGELAESLILDQTAFSRNVRILIENGLIQVDRGDDRRHKLLRLTNKGERILSQAIPLWMMAQKQVESIYGAKGWDQLIKSLAQLESAGIFSLL